MPERPDASFVGGVNAFGVLPAENFIPQCWTENADHKVDRGSDQRDLNSARPRKIRQPNVVVSATRDLRLIAMHSHSCIIHTHRCEPIVASLFGQGNPRCAWC